MAEPDSSPDLGRAGLCALCAHARRIRSDRGSVFFQCTLAARDPRFRRYPALPVLTCAGFVPGAATTEEMPAPDAE